MASTIKRDVVYSTVINANNQGGAVKIVTALCTVCIWLFFAARLMVRWPLNELFGKDDYVTTAATVVSLAQQILVNVAVSQGLGRRPDLPSHAWISVDMLVYASDLLFIVASWVAKLAIVVFFMRLTVSSRDKALVTVLLFSGGLLATASLLLIASQEHGYRPRALSDPKHGRELASSWTAVELMGDVYEIGLLVFPIYLVVTLHMRIATRVKVVFAFVLRAPILALSGVRIAYVWRACASADFLYAYATVQILTQLEMTLTVISATVVCLRIFLMAARSGIQTVPGFTARTASRRRSATASSGPGKSPWPSKAKASKKSRSSNHTTGTSTLVESFEVGLSARTYGETITEAARNDSVSLGSQASESAIVVRQTVDVTIDTDRTQVDAIRTAPAMKASDV